MSFSKLVLRKILFQFPSWLEKISHVNRSLRFQNFENRLLGKLDLSNNRQDLHSTIRRKLGNIPIDYFEFGVYSGKSFLPWLEENKNPSSKFYGFDTFTGLPEDWDKNRPKGTFDTNDTVPDTKGDHRATFIKGTFQETLYKFLDNYVRAEDIHLIIHIDCDIFTGAIYSLFGIEPYLKSGDIIIFDEFKDHNNEFRAFEIFTSSTNIELQPFLKSKSNNQWAFAVHRTVY
tara:strand:+ start:323 stop:1015 length:693 start_codon:yes stop_codon:yes gene_type:complete